MDRLFAAAEYVSSPELLLDFRRLRL